MEFLLLQYKNKSRTTAHKENNYQVVAHRLLMDIGIGGPEKQILMFYFIIFDMFILLVP